MSAEESDLPVYSNESAWKVQHFIMSLSCDVEEEIFQGTILLFLKSRGGKAGDDLILDCRDLVFENVFSIRADNELVSNFLDSVEDRSRLESLKFWLSLPPRESLAYTVSDWCINIKDVARCCTPCVIAICYKTKPEGTSVMWRKDQDNNKSAYTAGSLINNRALFACQDGPGFMATWQAVVRVPRNYTCLCTGDEPGVLFKETNTSLEFYFYTNMLLPASTFAVAIGKWKEYSSGIIPSAAEQPFATTCSHEQYPCHFQTARKDFPYRIFGPKSLDPVSFIAYVPSSIAVCQELFGILPVSRVDFLIMPRSFASLGLCSPNLIFVSQSVVTGTHPMLHRISHELSHFWFGVNIGPKKWTEEWMSEGFATYCEDMIHFKMDPNFSRNIRIINRFQVLQADAENIEEELQILAPTSDNELAVKNGLNEEKAFSQIHYIKGYLLLLQLEETVGLEKFTDFLKKYVQTYHGCLVSAEEFLDYFYQSCITDKTQFNFQVFTEKWLHTAKLPEEIHSYEHCPAYEEVLQEFNAWKMECTNEARSKRPRLEFSSNLTPDQKIALFDKLLELGPNIPSVVVSKVQQIYSPESCNPDVAHRFYELAVSSHYLPALQPIQSYLIDNQSMGVYLYGELMLTEKYRFQNAALQVYRRVQMQLEPQMKRAIKELLQL